MGRARSSRSRALPSAAVLGAACLVPSTSAHAGTEDAPAAAQLVPVAAGATTGFGDLPPPPRTADRLDQTMTQRLELELVVNGLATGQIVPARLEANRFALRPADLHKAGLALPGGGSANGAAQDWLFVDSLAGVAADYDAPRQRLYLTVAPEYLPGQRMAAAERPYPPASYDTGALLNYDVYVSGGGKKVPTRASLFHEVRMFSRAGVISSTGVLRSGAGKAYIRFDTSFRRSDEATTTTIEVGDLITRSLPYAGAVRLGGIQVSRDFSVRPDIVTYPLPAFAGTAALPSTVDLVVDGQRIAGGTVNPGPFTIDALPPINGRGEANLIVTDMHGRTVQETLPFYVASDLLKPGLTDFAVAFGSFRENYGRRNFDYGGVAATASARRGVTDSLTLEVRAEIADDMSLAGGGATVRLGRWGTLSASYSRSFRSVADGGNGEQITLGYDYQMRGLSIGLRHSRRSGGYVDLGLLGQRSRGWQRVTAATVALSLGRMGTLGVGWFDIREELGADTRLANASWSLPLWRGARIHASASREFEDESWSGALTLSLPLGGRAGTLSASLIENDGDTGWRADYSRPLPVAGGWGLSASAFDTQGGDFGYRGDAAWRTGPVELRTGAYGAGDVTGWFGASGSIVYLDGSLFAANRVADSFAVVSTGAADIPVRYENQFVGTTDGDGKLLIPAASPWYAAKYEIDPLDLPANVDVPVVEQRAAVPTGGGHVVRFAVTVTSPARAILKDKGGLVIPAGSRADISVGSAMTDAIVGWDGILFIDALGAGPEAVSIRLGDGRQCELSADTSAAVAGKKAQSRTSGEPPTLDLGEVTCA